MSGKREMRSVAVRVDRAVVALSEAAKLLSGLGLEQQARQMNNAAFEAVTALSLADARLAETPHGERRE